MTVSIVGVEYNTTTLIHRILHIPEEGDGLEDQHILDLQANPRPGRAIAIVPISALPLLEIGQPDFRIETVVAVLAVRGGPVLDQSPPCAAVDDNGNIVDVFHADVVETPKWNGHTVVKNPHGAMPGDIWDGHNFKRSYALLNKQTRAVVSVVELPLPQFPATSPATTVVANPDPSDKVIGRVIPPTPRRP